jgi:hypothetical protein
MMHDQSLSMILWEEARMETIYVHNKSSHHILKNITTEEDFTGVKSEIEHFRIFGFPMYFYVPKEKRSKLDPLGRKDTFMGYNESLNTYQIYIPGRRQIEISRDVVFEEEIAFQRSRESQMEIDSETIPSPPSAVQRETNIILVTPVDMPRDIVVGHKRPS